MTTTEAVVAIIVALLSGGTIRSLVQYLRERRERRHRMLLGHEDLSVTTSTVATLQAQIEAMSAAFDKERESYQTRDQLRRQRIEELEDELEAARRQLDIAQRSLVEVSRQVELLTQRLASLAAEE